MERVIQAILSLSRIRLNIYGWSNIKHKIIYDTILELNRYNSTQKLTQGGRVAVTLSKHIRHTRVIGLYLEVAMGAVKDL